MNSFDHVSDQYRQKSHVQQAAAEKLLSLVTIGGSDDVLDVACGPGHITWGIKTRTQGRVTGVDISAGMIGQAQTHYPTVEFRQLAAEDLDYREQFDVVICNSSLQWFTQPERAVAAMRTALRAGGRIGVSCPGTRQWSACFRGVAEDAASQPDIRATFAHWKSPWFYLPDAAAYQSLFESPGFRTVSCRIEAEEHLYETEQAFSVFTSGAGVGFTNRASYDVPIDDGYVARFLAHVRKAMERRSDNGRIKVDFHRLYYLGVAA